MKMDFALLMVILTVLFPVKKAPGGDGSIAHMYIL